MPACEDVAPQFSIQLRNPAKSLTLLGIHVDHSDGQRLLVEWIAEKGLFAAWNTAHQWQQVEVGDRIASVNGKTGAPRELIRELGNHEFLELAIMKHGKPAKPNSAGQPGSVMPEPRMADGGRSDALVHLLAGTRVWKPPPPVVPAKTTAPADADRAGEEYSVALQNPRKSLSSLGLHVDHSDGKTLLIEKIGPKGIFAAWNAADPVERIEVGDRIVAANGESGSAIKLASLLGKHEELRLTLRRPRRVESVFRQEGPQPRRHQEERATGRLLYTYPLDADEPSALEGAADGGPRWFRVTHHPHTPSRVRPDREALVYTALNYCEVVEAALVQDGWVRLAPAELWRRGLPQEDEAWALVDATCFGLGRLLAPFPAPPRPVAEAGTVILWSLQGQEGPSEAEMPGDATPSAALSGAERVVAENDKAWEILQQRRRRLREEEERRVAER